jgi:very-short-patch-repair endonuclease
MLTAAVRFGVIRRARNGWYSTYPPSDPRFRAIRVGGRLTGLSAFDAWGAWVWRPAPVIHISVPPNAARLRRQPGVRIHHESLLRPGTKTSVSVVDALVRVLLDEPAEVAVPCADWARRTERIGLIDFETCLLQLPRRLQHIRELCDRNSQSVVESVARVRLRQSGFRVHSQQRTGDLGATDLVVEDHVALELDGRAFHADSFERDRRRDLVTTIEGRHVIRVSALMVRDSWGQIDAAIRQALAARGAGNSGDIPPPLRGKQRAHGRSPRVS